MRIAQLAPTYERVPPVAYGGTELVVSLLTDRLVARGHEVTLFASGDSVTDARLVSVTRTPIRYGDASRIRHPEWVQLANAQACFRAAATGMFDLVHNHASVEGLVLGATCRRPVVTTNHGTYAPETWPVWSAYPWFHHGVSAAHSATFPERGRLPAIHHGLEIESIPFGARPQGYLLFLGRFSREKGPDVAVQAARLSGRRLLMAGKVDTADQAFFDAEVAPLVDGEQIQLVGEVEGERKRDLIAGADALLFPIRWDEPFGLVMIEALAAGAPVIAFARGSVPEVIDDGRTGFVVRDGDVEAMAASLERLPALDRAACRREAQERFGLDRMVDDYERMYASVLEAARSGEAPLPSDEWTPLGPGRGLDGGAVSDRVGDRPRPVVDRDVVRESRALDRLQER